MDKLSNLEILNLKGITKILSTLQEHDGISRQKLVEYTRISGNTIDKRIGKLEQKGLLIREEKAEYQGTTKIYLTDKGKQLAKSIDFQKVEEILK